MYRHYCTPWLTAILINICLTACGGGGGSSNPPPAPSSNAANDSASVNEDASVEINVTANDTNVTSASVEISSEPSHGSVSVASNGVVTYTPNPDYEGTDSFNYQVTSNNNTGTPGATVSITVIGVNDPPVGVDDSATTLINTPVILDVLSNDTDIDNDLSIDGLTITTEPGSGSVSINVSTNDLVYTPAAKFTGTDAFSYTISDATGSASDEVTVSLTIIPIESTTLTVFEYPVPTDNYTAAFSEELGEGILQSEPQLFTIPPNTVAFAIHLIGEHVNVTNDDLFINELVTPDGLLLDPIFRTAEFCDAGYCSVLVPKRPDIPPTAGDWEFRIATTAAEIAENLTEATLNIVIRTGPEPAYDEETIVSVLINTVVTGSKVEPEDLVLILDNVTDLFALNGIEVLFDPITTLDTAEFAEVSKDFDDPVTSELILTHAMPDRANLFILDSFSGFDGLGLLGITGGIPASVGLLSQYNGVLINGTAMKVRSNSFYTRSTAEIITHELGHYLGLNHTTEANFSNTDLVDDTPECLIETHDSNGNGFADQDECPDGLNMMFWENEFNPAKSDFSSDQQRVMGATPVGVSASSPGED
jgi:hypothetical protein